jgi:hypothetical protein
MRDAIQAAHGRQYAVKAAVGLYPTSGTSDDYAYGRTLTGTYWGLRCIRLAAPGPFWPWHSSA